MTNPVIVLRWKRSATAADMSEVLRTCRAKGWRVMPCFGVWMIFTRMAA